MKEEQGKKPGKRSGVLSPRPPGGAARRAGWKKSSGKPYPLELRREAVRLHLEEGFTLTLVAGHLGITRDTLWSWVQRYRRYGEAGLAPQPNPKSARPKRLPAAVHDQIVRIKTEHPGFGIRRIAQWMRRALLLPASPETVRQTLHEHQLLPKKPRKSPHNPPKPRFFRPTCLRSMPNTPSPGERILKAVSPTALRLYSPA